MQYADRTRAEPDAVPHATGRVGPVGCAAGFSDLSLRPCAQADSGLAIARSPRVAVQRALHQAIDGSARVAAQRDRLAAGIGPDVRPAVAPVQRVIDPATAVAALAVTVGIATAVGAGIWACLRWSEPAAARDTGLGKKRKAKKKSPPRKLAAATPKKAAAASTAPSRVAKDRAEPESSLMARIRTLRAQLQGYREALKQLREAEAQPIGEVLQEATDLLAGAPASAAPDADLGRVGQLLQTVDADLEAFFADNFTKVENAPPRLWTVAEFEGARGGRKAKFQSLFQQGLIGAGAVMGPPHSYVTSYESPGGFATAIQVAGAPSTEIHTHYDANDDLQAAHFKPSVDRYVPGHALNSLTPSQTAVFVNAPMAAHYGVKPWGAAVAPRK